MPQLNPLPWLIYFFLAWLILITLAPSKILSHLNPHTQKSESMSTPHSAWAWPW